MPRCRYVLEAERLSVSYGRIRAVEDVSLTVRRGEVVALLGANGAGKSSVLKAIIGLVRLRSGEICFEGRRIGGLAAQRILPLGIAYVPEGRLIVGTLSVRDNLRLGALASRPGTALDASLAEILETFPQLRSRLEEPGANLSGGEAQMLALARGLMARPRLMLLDEPALGLSPRLTEEVFALIAGLKTRGVTILLVEQNVFQALSIADRAYLIESGRIVREGAASLLARDRSFHEAYLGLEPERLS